MQSHPHVLAGLACGTPPASRQRTLDKRLAALAQRFDVAFVPVT